MSQLSEDASGEFGLPRYVCRVLQMHPSHYREAFFSILRGGNATTATAAVRVLLALLLCRAVDNSLLDAAGTALVPVQAELPTTRFYWLLSQICCQMSRTGNLPNLSKSSDRASFVAQN